eukprot:4213472-Alexandrium_andersonii.AAC.1
MDKNGRPRAPTSKSPQQVVRVRLEGNRYQALIPSGTKADIEAFELQWLPNAVQGIDIGGGGCLLYTSPSPRD